MVKFPNSLSAIVDEAYKEYYDVVIKAFERHGFTERWIIYELFKSFEKKPCRISRYIEGTKDYWAVDGIIIFSIEYNAQASLKDVAVNFIERDDTDENGKSGKAQK